MSINLDNIFTYHPPINDQVERYQVLRDAAKEVAKVFLSNARVEAKQRCCEEYLQILDTNVPSSHQRYLAREAVLNAFKLATNEQNQRIVDLVLTASMFANASIAINES